MNKQEFLVQLRKGLSGLPKDDIDERITFYGEMIDDRIEDGISEEAAVDEIGTVDELISQIIADIPFTKLVKEKIKPKRKMKTWEIVLLALGSPIWFSLLIALASVIFSLYISLWAVIIAFWSVFVSLAACGLAGIAAGVYFAVSGNILTGIAVTGAGFFAAGLSVFTFFGCKAATKGTVLLTKKVAILIKNCFISKEEK